jgi:radical SAM superfamily enzyme YgiQ (UPF0313 family)
LRVVADIVLTTLNARYAHASFGLRYLMANLPPALRGPAAMLEFDISQRAIDIVERIIEQSPRIVGVGVYIWNAAESLAVVASLKRVRPDVIVVLGGPEVSYETDRQEIVALADYVVTGEADLAFGELCATLLEGKRPLQKVFPAALPEFELKTAKAAGLQSPNFAPDPRIVALPYDLYTDCDLAHRVVYVEASRGCPFKCEFCLSSLDVPVRNVPIEALLAEMQKLLDRGLRQFKFVDRTFNLNLNISRAILEFFLARYRPGLFLHFEMIPDRLPEALRAVIARFPPGALQFEVGVQTFNDDVSARISRRQDNEKLADNLRFLREQTGVHVHADLIVGLPGESIESFGQGFDRLVAMRPQEIQVGMLKRLRGTPIVRHDQEFGMVYAPHPPYEVLRTRDIDFPTMQRMRRFARYWDLIANSGNFIETTPRIWSAAAAGEGGLDGASPFWSFLRLCDWLRETSGRTHAIALKDLARLLYEHLTTVRRLPADIVAQVIWRDYQRGGRSDMPEFLRPYVGAADTRAIRARALASQSPPRQARHLRG